MAALQQFQLYIKGPDLYNKTDSGLNYGQFVDSLLSETGPATAASFERTEYNNLELSYNVTIDTLEYPTLKDYAKKLKNIFTETLSDNSVKAEILKIGGENARDVIYFTLDYKYKLKDLENDLEQAKKEYDREKELIAKYNAAVEKGDLVEAERIKNRIQKKQKVEVTPVSSAAETELEKKAIGKEEEKKEETLPAPPVVQPQQPQVVQPVIVTPTEKTTVTATTDKSKERSLIESVSSIVFDKKILQYEKTASERLSSTTEARPEKSATVSAVSTKEGLLSQSTILKESQSIEKLLMGAIPAIADTAVKSIVPSEVSKIVSSIFSSNASENVSSILGKDVTDTIKNQITEAGTIISSISDTIKLMQNSVSSVSSTLQDATIKIGSAFNTVAKESSAVVGLATSTTDTFTNKLNEVAVKSERNTTDNTILADIQRKVVGLETESPLKTGVSELTTNIGDSIKNLVTSITDIGKTNNTQVGPSTSVSLANPTSTSITNKEESATSNLGTQLNQNFVGGQSAFPSVVSLSQSTIDNLASAIIKNMSITPFLNSGR